MKNKEKYYQALLENKGRINEITLGESIGFDENETGKIIAQLLSEYKIQYIESRTCSYILTKELKKRK